MDQPRCPTTDKWNKKMWHLHRMEFYAATKKNDIFCHSQVNGEAKLGRLRMLKIACSPPYVDNRPKTNAVILLDMSHTLRGERAWEEY
jgi:hypothetical protein